MNQFAIIFFSLVFFYISYAPAQAQRKVYWALKEARIQYWHRQTPTQTFTKSVYLYSEGVTKWKYVVGDSSGDFSADFPVRQNNSAVTDEKVTIRWFDKTVSLTFYGDALEFYKSLYKLENFSHEFNVSKVWLEEIPLKNVSVIKAIKSERLLVALEGNEPRLIFSKNCSSPRTNQNPKQVSIALHGLPVTREIKVEFDHAVSANVFGEFFRSL